ncbi:hypothetical protein GUJ93_ZPchr0007g5731 [Zizania palustris]|uniref:VQ domain-containing protein n=1 Tax=Zizania palustris TaxID=103762 RepID=A0A8J5VYQ0_ZIZPA|nr:hypothetical protein GUJ93_ZPchr0007g5731 [Zizania palustris]
MDALSCLAPLPYTGFSDAAIARAFHFSMADDSSVALLADYGAACGGGGGGFASALPAITCESVLVADRARPSPAAGRRHQQLGLAGGRAGKRRSRASKRAPTTYISTDPSNFRLMVQQVTGVQADPISLADGIVLPPTATTTAPFDASLLLDPAAPHHAAEFVNQLRQAAASEQEALQQQPCFPTLDSWSVMYESSELL